MNSFLTFLLPTNNQNVWENLFNTIVTSCKKKSKILHKGLQILIHKKTLDLE